LNTNKGQGHLIKEVYPDSIAEELEIEAGDLLLAINGEQIEDVFDYRYLIQDEYIEVLIQKQNGEEWLLELDKNEEEDLGIEFESSLMSNCRFCHNQCIFCFIDQMPPGMRETLYFKDDDSRLSFLQGNYITLTNMQQKDIDRIIHMRLAPINISIQATNPDLRCKMLSNRFAGEKLQYLDALYKGQIDMNGQIVLCRGVNDGDELKRSIDDLAKYIPYLRSVSVVPAGITKYRDGLYPLECFNKQEAEAVIDLIEKRQKECYAAHGLHFIHASDEWYILAERDFPKADSYDGYLQLENGVGMMRLLIDEFHEALEQCKLSLRSHPNERTAEKTLTIATGKLAYPTISAFATQLMELFPKLKVQVISIRNDFFGETITVSGLITGQDLIRQLQEKKGNHQCLGDCLVIPSNMLRAGEETFLDDVTVRDVEQALQMKVVIAQSSGQALLDAIIG